MRSYKTYPHASADWDARRARCVQLREPRTLLVYYLLQGVSEFDWGAAGPAAVIAASAAAATQRSPAAGASGEVRSQVKNQAFPSFLILQDTSLCPGLVYIPSPGSMSRCFSKNFWEFSGVFIPKVARKFAGRARCVETWLLGSRPVGISFTMGVWEFGSLQGVWEFGFVSCAPGAGRPDAGKLSTAYPQLSLY